MACKYLKGLKDGNKSKNCDEEKSNCSMDSSNCDKYFTYDILRLIFEHLNYNDLRNVGKVCRLWAEAADNEKKKRLAPECILLDCKDIFSRNNGPSHKVDIDSNDQIKKLMIKPSLGLYFTGFKVLENYSFAVYFDNHDSLLSRTAARIMITGSGTIMEDTENERNRSELVCTFLPEIPGVNIETFICDGSADQNVESNAEIYNKLIKFFGMLPFAKTHNKRCCLLLVTTEAGHDIAEYILLMLRGHYQEMHLPIWGGIVEHLIYSPSDGIQYETPGCICIAIAGSGIRSWSYTINNCKTEEKLKEKLTLFRQKVKLRKHSLGFMFACCQRGKKLYSKSSVEASTFKAIFPEVKLVGCFGYGEFGTTTIKTDDKQTKSMEWYNELTTVFLIITYG